MSEVREAAITGFVRLDEDHCVLSSVVGGAEVIQPFHGGFRLGNPREL